MKLKAPSLSLALVLIGQCALLVGATLTSLGCGMKDESQESSEYKKLPPGEGPKRLAETLAKRNGGRAATPTGNPPASTGSTTGN